MEPSPTAQPHGAGALLASTAPAPCKAGPWGAVPWQPGAPARFGDVTAALDLCGCAAASQALTQQQAAPSPTLRPGGKSVAWPLRRGKFAEEDATAVILWLLPMAEPSRSQA